MQIDAAFQLIRHAHAQGRLANAYVIAGPTRGAGGELATRLLQLLFCGAGDRAPCGTCQACRQVAERTWADVFWLKPEKKSRAISAEAMREKLLAEVAQTSLAGGWKAAVIVGADRMTDAAANVFLKTLEEPPPQTLFLLLTDSPQLLLPTIVSRCQRVELESASQLAEPWRSRLLEVLTSPDPPGVLVAMGQGARLGAILDDMKDLAAEEVKAEVKREAGTVDEEDEVVEARISARFREMRADLLRAWLQWYRDLLVLRAGGDPALAFFQDQLPQLRERAGRLTLAQALANVEGLEDLNRQLERNLSQENLLAYWMDRFFSGVPAPAAAGRAATT
jgi:DNA polymerase-3 subunit delta'